MTARGACQRLCRTYVTRWAPYCRKNRIIYLVYPVEWFVEHQPPTRVANQRRVGEDEVAVVQDKRIGARAGWRFGEEVLDPYR